MLFCRILFVRIFFRIHFRHIQKAAHTQIVGQAAVYQVDVGSVFPVCVFLEALVKFFYGAALLSACFAVVCIFDFDRRCVVAASAVVV